MMIIACIGCKTDIEFNHPRRRLCEDCKKQRQTNRWQVFNEKNRKYKETVEKICPVCKVTYFSKRKNCLTCSSYQCKNYFYNLKRKVWNAEKSIKFHQSNIDTWNKEYERISGCKI